MKDNTNMDTKHWIYPPQDRNKWQAILNKVMSLQVLYDVGYFETSWGTLRISYRTLLHAAC